MSLISLFLRLIVVHQIADFPLQANWIFRIRQKYSWGPLVHIAPHVLTLAILFLPFAACWVYWANLAILAVSHFIIDKMRKNNIWLANFGSINARHRNVGTSISAASNASPVSFPNHGLFIGLTTATGYG